MNGFTVKYLYYKSNKLSIITIPRSIINAFGLFWNNKDIINIIYREVQFKEGLFLFKKDESYKEKYHSYLDEYKKPIISYGHPSIYRYYEKNKQSLITIPRAIIETANLNWQHKDNVAVLYNEFENQKGFFVFKEVDEVKEILDKLKELKLKEDDNLKELYNKLKELILKEDDKL